MRFDVITIFPEIFNAYLNESILKRAAERNIIEVKVHDLRDFTTDRHRTVDDYPYGGGQGMVMKPEPFFSAVEHIKSDGIPRRVVMLTPHGKTFSQDMAFSMSGQNQNMILICGRYEAIDERVKSLVDEEISIGDYILTGGELPALVIIDGIVRLIPGVLGDERSAEEESFACGGILEYPHYTRPSDFRGLKVPEVLLSGNHRAISQWRRKEALRLTIVRRPDLMQRIPLKDEDYKLVSEIKEEEKKHEYD